LHIPSNITSDTPSGSPSIFQQPSIAPLNDNSNEIAPSNSTPPTILTKSNQPIIETDNQSNVLGSTPYPSTLTVSDTLSPSSKVISPIAYPSSVENTPLPLPTTFQPFEDPAVLSESSETSIVPTSQATAQSTILIKTNPPKYEFENVITTYYLPLEIANILIFSKEELESIEVTVRDFLNFEWPFDPVQGTAIVNVDVKSQSILSKSNMQIRRRHLQSSRNVVVFELAITGVISQTSSYTYDFSTEVNTVFENEKLVLIYMLSEKGIIVNIPSS
jgi:hypothetical protein